MKKKFLYLSTGFVIVFLGCSHNMATDPSDSVETPTLLDNTTDNNVDQKEKDIREVAFKQLPDARKSFIEGSWEDVTIESVVVSENGFELIDDSYIGKEVIAVNFITDLYSEPGMMRVLLSEDTYTLIGYGILQ